MRSMNVNIVIISTPQGAMNSGDYRATALLTEHLGFAPLTLVDEVINAVNKIMYKCTDALEAFLKKRRDTQLARLREMNGIKDDDADINVDGLMEDQIAAAEKRGEVYPLTEIHHGTSELETLLVSHVDRNFDKFELYTLRNILTIPRDLVEGGWIRLKHHEHLDTVDLKDVSEDVDARIKGLIRDINVELQLRKLLYFKLSKAKKLVSLLTRYKHGIEALVSPNADSELSEDTVRKLKESLTPMNENVYYLITQSKDLVSQISQLNQTLAKYASLAEESRGQYRPSNRDTYLHEKTTRLLETIAPATGH